MRRARIRWLATSDGPAPRGPGRYTVVVRFEDPANAEPEPGWSVLLRVGAPADANGDAHAVIALLVPEDSSCAVLLAGRRFDVFEGPLCVGHGEVL